jgi:hypothetical protein
MNRYVEQGSHAGDWLISTARRKPEAFLLLAAGAALLARGGLNAGLNAGRANSRPRASGYEQPERHAMHDGRDGSSTREGAMRAGSSMLGEGLQQATDYASDVTDRVTDAAGSYAGAVADYASSAGRGISEGSQRLYRQAQSTVQDNLPRLADQPILVAGLGLAAGAVVAAMFPPTQIERQAASDARDALADAAGKFGDNLSQVAGKAGENLKNRVAAGGLDADGLKDMAREAVSSLTGSGQDNDTRQGQGSSQSQGSSQNKGPSQGQGSSQAQGASQNKGGPQGQASSHNQGASQSHGSSQGQGSSQSHGASSGQGSSQGRPTTPQPGQSANHNGAPKPAGGSR